MPKADALLAEGFIQNSESWFNKVLATTMGISMNQFVQKALEEKLAV